MAISVTVVFARPEGVWVRAVQLHHGASVADALQAVDFTRYWPETAHGKLFTGVFGQRCQPDHPLSDGDRVEVYRPLVFDPTESRRRRAAHRKAQARKAGQRPAPATGGGGGRQA